MDGERFEWRIVGQDEWMLVCRQCMAETSDGAMASKFNAIKDRNGMKYHMCVRCGTRDLSLVHRP